MINSGGGDRLCCLRTYPGGPDYRPYAPLLVLIGAKDDWTPAAPCVQWTERAQALGAPMRIKVYPDAHHGFDAPNNPVHFAPRSATGTNPAGAVAPPSAPSQQHVRMPSVK